MKCKTCHSSFAQHELENDLCLRCTARELVAALERERVLRDALSELDREASLLLQRDDCEMECLTVREMACAALAATATEASQ